jgi:predicted lipoprotein with Yx(FWY)xxD motif
MKRTYIIGGVIAAAALAGGGAALDVALAGPGTPAASAAAPGTPSVAAGAAAATPAGLGTAALAPGTALVDAAGRTLYLFEADKGTTSACTGACAQVWPPVPASASPVASGAAQVALVGATTRTDGTRQATYNGHPLYYFAADKTAGDVKGQGINNFGGSWYVVAPDGNKIDTDDDAPAAAPAPMAPAPAPVISSGSGGYGY